MDAPSPSLALRVARGVSVLIAVAAMAAFVVLEHRRLNFEEPGEPSVDESPGEEPAVPPAGEVEIEDVAVDDVATSERVAFEFPAYPEAVEVPTLRLEISPEQLRLPQLPVLAATPDLLPEVRPDEELLVYTTTQEIYMSSSKFAGPPPKDKRSRNANKRP